MHLYYYHYRKKFNILHSFDSDIHLHTVEVELVFSNENHEFDKFSDVENTIVQCFQRYDNQCLNDLKEFHEIMPTIENLGYFLYENIKNVLAETNYKLVKLDIGENPSRIYTITDFLITGELTKDSLPNDYRTKTFILNHYNEVLNKYQESQENQGNQGNQEKIAENLHIENAKECLAGVNQQEKQNIQSYELEGWEEFTRPVTIKSKLLAMYGYVYTLIASILFGLYLFTIKSIPSGDEIYLHLGKAKYLYSQILNNHFSPIYMLNWFNGYLMFVKSPPLPYYLLACCQWITGGDVVTGYYVLITVVMVVGSFGFVALGRTCNKSILGIMLGIVWLFIPETIRVVVTVGDIQYLVAMAFVPHLFLSVYQYLKTNRKRNLFKMALLAALICLSDFEVTLIAFLSVFVIFIGKSLYFKKGRKLFDSYIWILIGIGFTMPWLYEAVVSGKIWTYHVGREGFYLDVVLIGLLLLSAIFIDHINRFYLLASFILLMLSIGVHPYFLTFAYLSFFISLVSCNQCRKRFLFLIISILILNVAFNWSTISKTKSTEKTTSKEIELRAKTLGIDSAMNITKNRLLILGIGDEGSLPVYYALMNHKNVLYSYGIVNHSLVINSNIEQLKYALYTKHFEYIFDRSIELGCDVILISKNNLRFSNEEITSLNDAAEKQGFTLQSEDGKEYLFKKDISGTYGTNTKYEGLAIGSSSKIISIMYPYYEEGHSNSLDDYDVDDLLKYKKIYLSGIQFKDRSAAEEKIEKLGKAGVEVLIDMDSIPNDEATGRQKFLGVTAQNTVFHEKFPTLMYKGNAYVSKNFSEGNSSFGTVYLENMKNATGYVKMGNKVLSFYGTSDDSNIKFISFNMLYHTLETNDEQTNRIISDIIGLDQGSTPTREIESISIEYQNNIIKINSNQDGVNTALSYQDEFYSKNQIDRQNNLLIVNKGETIIHFSKYDMKKGIVLTVIEGIALMITLLYKMIRNKIEKDLRNANKM